MGKVSFKHKPLWLQSVQIDQHCLPPPSLCHLHVPIWGKSVLVEKDKKNSFTSLFFHFCIFYKKTEVYHKMSQGIAKILNSLRGKTRSNGGIRGWEVEYGQVDGMKSHSRDLDEGLNLSHPFQKFLQKTNKYSGANTISLCSHFSPFPHQVWTASH